jgi:hypothetical protein
VKPHRLRGHGTEERIRLRRRDRQEDLIRLLQRVSLPKFPALDIDGAVLFEGRDITSDELEAAIKRRS